MDENVCLSPVSCVAIFSNMLSNAFEGASSVADGNGFVEFLLKQTEDAIFAECRNNYSGEIKRQGKNFVTIKADDNMPHGLGTEIIKDTVVSLSGKADFSFENHIFSVTVYFPLTEAEN